MNTADALRAMCDRSAVSASAASIAAGLDRSYIAGAISQGNDTRAGTLARIARALGYGLYLIPLEQSVSLLDADAIPITGETD